MGKIKLTPWDSAEHLKTDEDIALYLEACFDIAGDDAAFIAKALGNVARAKGMSQLALAWPPSCAGTTFRAQTTPES